MKKQGTTSKTQLTEVTARRSAGLWRDAWRRLRRNRAALASLIFICVLAVVALAAPLVAPYHYAQTDLSHAWEKPSGDYLLGTDGLGRDVLSRVIYGARVSLSVALVAQLFMISIGVPMGLTAGYVGGKVEAIIMRGVDAMFAFPHLLLIIVVMTTLKASLGRVEGGWLQIVASLNRDTGGLMGVFIVLGFTWWLVECRLVRGVVLSLKQRDFILAEQALGASHLRIIVHHILPNCLTPIIVATTLGVPAAILIEAGISFLGLGVDPPMSSWGLMIADGVRTIRSYPHLIIAPAAALSVTLLAFNFLGDGLRDALDPLMQGRKEDTL